MSPSSKPFTKPIQRVKLNLAVTRLAQELDVFVAGPFIDKNWTAEELVKQSAATRARLAVKDFIESDLQHRVVLGEHRGVDEIGSSAFGDHTSFAIAELALVRECEAIVIFPSSVGSFCELGAWSLSEHICRKMLIIPEKKFENEVSYLNIGTLRMAASNGASIIWRDLEDLESIMGDVRRFVGFAHDRAMVRSVTRD
ncbi:hypothetical protein [Caulobacter radicis]|uniref:hypothetical protein n=1 Tax=Caulobacter radicis TaxID=2172650 RepID=UPI0010579A8C|nr:hypothetical protein [Caulobacter radicis]